VSHQGAAGFQIEAGNKSPEDGNDEAGNQGRRGVRDKRVAEATDSWCANWVKKAEAQRREKENVGRRSKELEQKEQLTARAAEAAQREQQTCGEQLRGEEEQWLLEQLQRFILEVGEGGAQEIQEDVRARPSLRARLVDISRFCVE
jgi:hypothetical protein